MMIRVSWQISWASVPDKVYSVVSTATLGAPFQVVPGLESIAATAESTSAVDTRSNLGPTRFYRIVELP